jgi:hypothetical protein
MTIQNDAVSIRRLITAHTDDGKAYVAIDAEITNLKAGASGSTVRHVCTRMINAVDEPQRRLIRGSTLLCNGYHVHGSFFCQTRSATFATRE